MVPKVTASTPQQAARKSQACLPVSTGGREGNSLVEGGAEVVFREG